MKILVFENQLSLIKPTFESVNDLFYENNLEITYYTKSQDLKPFSAITDFDCVFVDISLATGSKLDGIGILQKLIDEDLSVNKVVVLTGDKKIEDKLESNGVNNYPILYKPIDFDKVYAVMPNNN